VPVRVFEIQVEQPGDQQQDQEESGNVATLGKMPEYAHQLDASPLVDSIAQDHSQSEALYLPSN
jgi:hypothetical protein